jgi:hypothetical protein
MPPKEARAGQTFCLRFSPWLKTRSHPLIYQRLVRTKRLKAPNEERMLQGMYEKCVLRIYFITDHNRETQFLEGPYWTELPLGRVQRVSPPIHREPGSLGEGSASPDSLLLRLVT